MAEVRVIKITGLQEFSRNLRKMDNELPKQLRLALNEVGEIIVEHAQPLVPSLTGRAASTVKAKSTRTSARVTGGSSKAPYYPWLDFGGSVGIADSVHRPFIKEGRFIYPAFMENAGKIHRRLDEVLVDVARKASMAIDYR